MLSLLDIIKLFIIIIIDIILVEFTLFKFISQMNVRPKILRKCSIYLFLVWITDPPSSYSTLFKDAVASRPPNLLASYRSIIGRFENNSSKKWTVEDPPIPPPIIAIKLIIG